jgi:hypothetical protein
MTPIPETLFAVMSGERVATQHYVTTVKNCARFTRVASRMMPSSLLRKTREP